MLRVTFNVGDRTIVAVGQVVWSTEIDPITMDVGIEFVEIDPARSRSKTGVETKLAGTAQRGEPIEGGSRATPG